MIIRVESTVTLHVDGDHYVKRNAVLEANDEELQHLFNDIGTTTRALDEWFEAVQAMVGKAAWDAVLDDVEALRDE